MLLKYYDFVTNEQLSGEFSNVVPELNSYVKLRGRDELWKVTVKCHEYEGPQSTVHIGLTKQEDIMKSGFRPWR